MKDVEYWHGTIKNYRYDGDVSCSMLLLSVNPILMHSLSFLLLLLPLPAILNA